MLLLPFPLISIWRLVRFGGANLLLVLYTYHLNFQLGDTCIYFSQSPIQQENGTPKSKLCFFWVRVLFKIFHVFSMCFPWKVGFFLHHQNVPSPSGHLGLTMVATSPHPPHIVVDHLAETWRQNGLLGSQRFQPTTNNPPEVFGWYWMQLEDERVFCFVVCFNVYV